MFFHHHQVKFIPEMEECFNIQKSINMMHYINKMKEQTFMIISTDAEKAFHEIQHSIMKNIPKK
jgi:hypothetical protein